jgi:Mn2+/Fe2+ NRAMP family transporter
MDQNQRDVLESQRKMLRDAEAQGVGATIKTYFKLSGPGFLQSAITLGGGSLAGALFLGVLGGYSLLWLQLLAVSFGVIMLGAISYVALSSGERPFTAIHNHISPVLAYGWAFATLMANVIWCLPQFSLSVAAARQNLLPSLLGNQSALGETGGKLVVTVLLLIVAVAMVSTYGNKGRGIKVFERLLKFLIAAIVLCFVGVVIKLAVSVGLPWGEIFRGYIPSLSHWNEPSAAFLPLLAGVAPEFQAFWRTAILDMQRDVMIAAASAAVGINMTFLLPYSLLNKGWDKQFRGISIFDLVLGLAIPFVLVTSCIVIAAASQFHAKPGTGLLDEVGAPKNLVSQYDALLVSRLQAEVGPATAALSKAEVLARAKALPEADRILAATLVKRDAFNLAETLAPLTGPRIANIVFGLGVFGMGLSTIVILMLISGFVITEVFGFAPGGPAHRWGTLIPAVGALGPFVWSGKVAFWLAVPTSVFAMVLLPIAYFTFLWMMNSRRVLGNEIPTGGKRVIWNILMIAAATSAAVASVWTISSKSGWWGLSALIVFILAIFITRRK